MVALLLVLISTVAGVHLSNTNLPVDSSGKQLRTGEADVLRVGNAFYFYFNNWGDCKGIDTCSSAGGCSSCPPRVSSDCVYDTEHVVRAYKTEDFSLWTDLGVVLPLASRQTGYLFRPHVVYNQRTGLYVMWFEDHSVNASIHGLYHVAVAPKPEGPFNVVAPNVSMPFGSYPVMHVGDFDIFVDDDGEAYHVRTGFSIVRLNSNYTRPLEVVSEFTTPKPSEAPTMFKRGDNYHILAGTQCCACPGGSNLYAFTASSPSGPWTFHGDIGSNASVPFDPHSRWNYVTRAQASAVFSVSVAGGGDAFVWLGNQWVTGDTRNHDLLYWSVLDFDAAGIVQNLHYRTSTEFDLLGAETLTRSIV